MVPSFPRDAAHGRTLPQSRIQRRADGNAYRRQTTQIQRDALFGNAPKAIQRRECDCTNRFGRNKQPQIHPQNRRDVYCQVVQRTSRAITALCSAGTEWKWVENVDC